MLFVGILKPLAGLTHSLGQSFLGTHLPEDAGEGFGILGIVLRLIPHQLVVLFLHPLNLLPMYGLSLPRCPTSWPSCLRLFPLSLLHRGQIHDAPLELNAVVGQGGQKHFRKTLRKVS